MLITKNAGCELPRSLGEAYSQIPVEKKVLVGSLLDTDLVFIHVCFHMRRSFQSPLTAPLSVPVILVLAQF